MTRDCDWYRCSYCNALQNINMLETKDGEPATPDFQGLVFCKMNPCSQDFEENQGPKEVSGENT